MRICGCGGRVSTRVCFHRGPFFCIIAATAEVACQEECVFIGDYCSASFRIAATPVPLHILTVKPQAMQQRVALRQRWNLYEWRRCDGDRAQHSCSLDLFVRWRYFFGSCSRHVINKSEHDVLDMPWAPYPPSHAEVSF